MLQFTHIVGAYFDQLGAWNMIMCRTRLSMQWYKVLQWIEVRERPNFYQLSDASVQNASERSQNMLLLNPKAWGYRKLPELIASLINVEIQVNTLTPQLGSLCSL